MELSAFEKYISRFVTVAPPWRIFFTLMKMLPNVSFISMVIEKVFLSVSIATISNFLQKCTLWKHIMEHLNQKFVSVWRFNWCGISRLTCKYISQKLHKWKPCWWKPHNVETRCTSNYSQLEKELHPIAGLTAWLELQLLENLFLSMPSKLSSLPDIMLRYSSYVLLWLGLCVFNFLSILSDFLSRERNGD